MYNLSQIVSRIVDLCNQRGISVNQMLSEANLSKSVIDNMKKGRNPSIDRIYQLADYFCCSVDYLLCREPYDTSLTESSFQPIFDREQQRLLDNYNKLTPSAQNALLQYIDFIVSQPNNLKSTTDTSQMIS